MVKQHWYKFLAFIVVVLATLVMYLDDAIHLGARQADIELLGSINPLSTVLNEPREVTAAAQHGPLGRTNVILRATGYNSLVSETDSTPFITATGERTRFGIVAVSRDLLNGSLPYGSLVRLKDLGDYKTGRGHGAFQSMLDAQGLFIVEDTMHLRKRQQVDIWFETYGQAASWGVRQVELEIVRYGRNGPLLDVIEAQPELEVRPQLVQRD